MTQTTTDPLVAEVHPNIEISGHHYFANGTSDPDQTRDRWTEVTVYGLSGGAYVVYGVGRSELLDETDRLWMTFCPSAVDLVHRLRRPNRHGGWHLPGYADMALRAAAERDSAVRTALAEWDAAARWAR